MMWKFILVLLLGLVAFAQQSPQLKTHSERQADSLPHELTETETQKILKERSPKSHVDATLKLSHERITSASKLVRESQYKNAVQDVGVYKALIVYADLYTRKLPDSRAKDRNNCLKKIEQAIFKQSRTADAVLQGLPFDYREQALEDIDQVKKIRLRVINDLLGGGNTIKTSDD